MILPNNVSFDTGAIVVVSIFLLSLGGVISLLFKLFVASKEDIIKQQNEAIVRLNRHLEQAKDQSGETTGQLITTLAGIATDSKLASNSMQAALKQVGDVLERVDKHIDESSIRSSHEHEKLLELVQNSLNLSGKERRQ